MWVTGQIETAVGNLRGILNAIYHRYTTEPQAELETHTCHIKLLQESYSKATENFVMSQRAPMPLAGESQPPCPSL